MTMQNKRSILSTLLFLLLESSADGFILSPVKPVSKYTQPSSKTFLRSSLFETNLAIQNVARNVQPSVALVSPKGVRNMTSRGSGFVLNGFNATTNTNTTQPFLYLITAAHVTPPGYGVELTFLGQEGVANSIPATVVARNQTLDLALLRITNEDNSTTDTAIQGLDLAPEEPPVGTLSLAHGYPASRLRGPAMTAGIVCGIAHGLGIPDDNNNMMMASNDSTTFVVTDAAMSGGMSGGPLVDINGNVLGVNALIRPDLRALGNYAVSAHQVRTFLDSISLEPPSTGSIDSYKLWLFNDPMNKKERVSKLLKEVAKLDETTANEVMMQAHTTGRGLVANATIAQEVTSLCQALREGDLLVEIEQISSN